MKKLSAAVACLAMVASLAPSISRPVYADKPPRPEMKLKVGDVAPDFKMQYFDGHDLKNVSLSDYRGKKNVVLAFYIFAFTGG